MNKLYLGLFVVLLVGCGETPTPAEPTNSNPPNEPVATETIEVSQETADTNAEANTTQGADSDKPLAVQDEDWQYIVNNAIRTADSYATKNNPQATFTSTDLSVDLVKQYGGEYEGQYLLILVNDSDKVNGVSYAQLLPLFDINSSIEGLDDEAELWRVVNAKYNGQQF